MTMTEKQIKAVPLPPKTSTYVPISHEDLISGIENLVVNINGEIVKRSYVTAENGLMVYGKFHIQKKNASKTDDPYQVILFQNSYNKRLPVRIAVGISNNISSMDIITNDISYKRRHTGSVRSDLNSMLNLAASYLNFEYEDLYNQVSILQSIPIGKRHTSRLLGELYFNKNVISANQASALNKIFKRKFKTENKITAYEFYTTIQQQIAHSHVSKQIEQFIDLTNFSKRRFYLI